MVNDTLLENEKNKQNSITTSDIIKDTLKEKIIYKKGYLALS